MLQTVWTRYSRDFEDYVGGALGHGCLSVETRDFRNGGTWYQAGIELEYSIIPIHKGHCLESPMMAATRLDLQSTRYCRVPIGGAVLLGR
jgi:hypothetical protein